jgi:hypothetical protein
MKTRSLCTQYPFIGAVFALSTLATAGPVSLDVDPTLSSLDLTITVDISLADDTDSDSSPLSGAIEIELDDAGNPSLITLTDMVVVADQTMQFNWSFGFFGSADASVVGGGVFYDTPGVGTGPVPIVGSDFDFPELFVNLGGIMDVSYDIFLVGSGADTVNLADQGAGAASFVGSISVDGDQITLTSILPIESTQPLLDSNGNEVGTVTTTGSATIIANGTAPSCPADLNGDGVLNFFDISAFLAAFTAMDPAADFTNDGLFNFFDVSAFLAQFTDGCP